MNKFAQLKIMTYCSECGVKNEDNSRFCQNCGAKIEQPAKNLQPQSFSAPSQPTTQSPTYQGQNQPQSSQPSQPQQSYTQNPGQVQSRYQQPQSQYRPAQSQYHSAQGYQRSYPPGSYMGSEKSMALGLILAFFIPGLGALYMGKFGKGLLYFFGTVLLASILIGIVIYFYQLYDTYKMIDINNKIHYGEPIY